MVRHGTAFHYTTSSKGSAAQQRPAKSLQPAPPSPLLLHEQFDDPPPEHPPRVAPLARLAPARARDRRALGRVRAVPLDRAHGPPADAEAVCAREPERARDAQAGAGAGARVGPVRRVPPGVDALGVALVRVGEHAKVVAQGRAEEGFDVVEVERAQCGEARRGGPATRRRGTESSRGGRRPRQSGGA